MSKTELKGPGGITLYLDDSNAKSPPTVALNDDKERRCIGYYDDALEWGTLYGDDADYEVNLTSAQLKWLEEQRPAVDEATILARV